MVTSGAFSDWLGSVELGKYLFIYYYHWYKINFFFLSRIYNAFRYTSVSYLEQKVLLLQTHKYLPLIKTDPAKHFAFLIAFEIFPLCSVETIVQDNTECVFIQQILRLLWGLNLCTRNDSEAIFLKLFCIEMIKNLIQNLWWRPTKLCKISRSKKLITKGVPRK